MSVLLHWCTIFAATVQVVFSQNWIQKPYSKNITVGSNVQIPCEIQNPTGKTIIWNKDLTPIFVNGQRGAGTSSRYQIGGNNTLVINNAQLSDTSFYSCTIFGSETAKAYLLVTGGSLQCLSCSGVESSSTCNHSISCKSDEACYSHHYVTESGKDNFDYGCSSSQFCSASAHRRALKEGNHNLCYTCCNHTDLCNRYSACESHYQGGSRSCLSCSEVSPDDTCNNVIQCQRDEICSVHYYMTESGDDKYDFGCSNTQSCPGGLNQFIGKRSDGRHSKCYACCNETELCNRQTTCNHNFEGVRGSHPLDCTGYGSAISSGVYTINPFNTSKLIKAYCKRGTDNLIWTVIQRRFNGTVSFDRNWTSYKKGFGDPAGEYWIGNDIIHQLTQIGNHELRIEMSDLNGKTRWAKYGDFRVDAEADNYRLHVGQYSGNAGDDFTYHNGFQFTTPDRDNDGDSGNNCALEYSSPSGWWFDNCFQSNLNGVYTPQGTYGVAWNAFSSTLKTDTMMVRRVS